MNRLDRHGDARRIGERQVALRRHRLGRHDLELAGAPARMKQQRFLIGDRGTFRAPSRFVGHNLFLVGRRERRKFCNDFRGGVSRR